MKTNRHSTVCRDSGLNAGFIELIGGRLAEITSPPVIVHTEGVE
jgi:hypothetical protein